MQNATFNQIKFEPIEYILFLSCDCTELITSVELTTSLIWLLMDYLLEDCIFFNCNYIYFSSSKVSLTSSMISLIYSSYLFCIILIFFYKFYYLGAWPPRSCIVKLKCDVGIVVGVDFDIERLCFWTISQSA